MRVWDVHPGYLSDRSLLGQHVEIHAVSSVISGGKKGYSAHPETLRWRGRLDRLRRRHDLTVAEMALRRFNHASPCPGAKEGDSRVQGLVFVDPPPLQFAILDRKYSEQEQSGRIPLPRTGGEFWVHHRYSVLGRGRGCCRDIEALIKQNSDRPISEAGELIMAVLQVMEEPLAPQALDDVAEALWERFKDVAADAEQERYRASHPGCFQSLLHSFYRMAETYERGCLLHSTIFADL